MLDSHDCYIYVLKALSNCPQWRKGRICFLSWVCTKAVNTGYYIKHTYLLIQINTSGKERWQAMCKKKYGYKLPEEGLVIPVPGRKMDAELLCVHWTTARENGELLCVH